MKMKNFRVVRAKRTVMGRMLCRLIGDEKGAVAMEYVVIALLIIAAAVGAAVYFGKTVSNRMSDVAHMVNDPDKQGRSDNIRDRQKADLKQGQDLTKGVSDNIAGANNFSASAAAAADGGDGGGDGGGNNAGNDGGNG